MNGVVWRKNWTRPLESSWSLIEKFKYANSLNNSELFYNFTDLKKQKLHFLKDRELLNSFRLEDAFGFYLGDYTVHNQSYINHYILFHNTFEIPRNYTPYLRWCNECMKHSFHSTFHQLKIFNSCHIHHTELISKCYSCGSIIPYTLHRKEIEAYKCPFCFDDYSLFITNRKLYFKNWSLNEEFSKDIIIPPDIISNNDKKMKCIPIDLYYDLKLSKQNPEKYSEIFERSKTIKPVIKFKVSKGEGSDKDNTLYNYVEMFVKIMKSIYRKKKYSVSYFKRYNKVISNYPYLKLEDFKKVIEEKENSAFDDFLDIYSLKIWRQTIEVFDNINRVDRKRFISINSYELSQNSPTIARSRIFTLIYNNLLYMLGNNKNSSFFYELFIRLSANILIDYYDYIRREIVNMPEEKLENEWFITNYYFIEETTDNYFEIHKA